VCGSFWGLNNFKMATVAMVTKVHKMLNSLQTSQMFAVTFPVLIKFKMALAWLMSAIA
jgi:hypothetical protein